MLILVGAIVLAWRARRVAGSKTLMFLALAALGLPILLALTGIIDVFFFRNALCAWLPLAIVLAAGLPQSRGGGVLAIAISVALLGSTLAVDARPGLQRDSWRQAAHALRQITGPRLIVGPTPDMANTLPLYWPNLRRLPASGARIREIDLVGRYVTASSRLTSLPDFRDNGRPDGGQHDHSRDSGPDTRPASPRPSSPRVARCSAGSHPASIVTCSHLVVPSPSFWAASGQPGGQPGRGASTGRPP